jgi:hypothetical protein
MDTCCLNEVQSTFFTNDNPLWQLLIGALGGLIALVVVRIQNSFQKNTERKKLSVELSASFAEKSSMLISAVSNFSENYATCRYYISTLHFFKDEFDKQAVVTQSNQANSDWKHNKNEQFKSISEIQGILIKYKIYFGENKKIDELLTVIESYRLPEYPGLEPNRTFEEVKKIKADYLNASKETINKLKITLSQVSQILKNNAKVINKK